jgi:hypothetical protein
LKALYLLVLAAACSGGESKAPESELRALLYCNQDWGSSPHRLLNDGNPHCETPCASFSTLEHHEGCTLVEATEVPCDASLTVEWEGWKGCCAPHGKNAMGNFAGVKFVACD